MSLFSAFLALVISLALMAAGSVFLVEEVRLSRNAESAAQASGAAEVAIGKALEDWDEAPGQPLGNDISLVRGGSLGLLVRLKPVAFPAAALVSGGSVSLTEGATVEGAVDSEVAGRELVGDLDLNQVAAKADLQLGPGRYVPAPAGGGRPPVVHLLGNAEVDGGDGSGVLLVDGDLLIDGPLTFRGVILVRGELVVSGSGLAKSHLYGSVVTFIGARGDSSVWITYSKSITDSVLVRFGTPENLSSRSWIRLF